MKNEIGKKIGKLMVRKVQKRMDSAHKTAIYSIGMAMLFAVPIFYSILANKVSFQDVVVLFLIVIGVSFTTIYILMDLAKNLGAKEKKLKKASK